jgi:hypothetical protein
MAAPDRRVELERFLDVRHRLGLGGGTLVNAKVSRDADVAAATSAGT